MILFVSKKRHLAELRRAQLRENLLRNAINTASEALLNAEYDASIPVRESVRSTRRKLILAVMEANSL